MFNKNINIKNILAIILAITLIFSSISITVFATPSSDIPDEMLDNVYLDALAYTGYDVQALKNNGQIFIKYGSMVSDSILSNISYDSSFANEGIETVTDTSTISGKAPNLARFEKYGLCCASYCSYVYFNYLPNIVGMDTSDYIRPTNLKSSGAWSTAAEKWVESGLAREIKFKQSSDGKTFTADEEIPIGSLIVFTASGTVSHVGLYAGKYNGKNFITHVGNSRGPEIITLEGLSKNGAAELVSSVIVPEIIEENGVIEVYKKDTNGKALSGAVFVATHKETGIQYKIGPTNSNGYAVSQERLPYGTYTVKETVFPTNYQSSGQSEWTVTVNSSNKGTVTINAVNEQIPGKVQIVKTSEDNKIDGISFRITGNGVDKTVKTENGGKITISNLKPGTYTVTETVEDKYEPQETRTVTVVSGQTSTVTFNNTLKRGDLKVIKTSEDGLNEGIKFHLYGTSHSGLEVDEYAVTNKNGIATFNDVLMGNNYTLEEVDTASKYVVPESQSANIEWNKVTEKSFHNILKKFTVTVTKADTEKGNAQGDATLTGAVYGIYNGDELIDKYTTDSNGKFTTKEYVCGDNWTLKEITASEGYLLDETVYKIGAEANNYTVERNTLSMNVTEQVIKGNIAIIKHSDDGSTQIEHPEVGAEFQVYLKSAGSYNKAKETERDTLVCDKNGFAQTKDFPYGTYTVHQTKGAEGREFMPDFDVIINTDGQTYRYLINNANFESYVKVIKKDDETGKTIPYAGAGFQIYDPDGELVTMTYTYPTPTTIDIFYTDASGSLITPEKLPYGKGYKLVEVQAPYGYVIDRTPITFDIVADTATEDNNFMIVVIEKTNIPQKGQIAFTKTGYIFTTVKEENGLYEAQFELGNLDGATVTITAAEDIYTPDGTLRYKKGSDVDIIITKADGKAISKPLYLGKYEIKESVAPYGYTKSNEIVFVELTYAGQEIDIVSAETSMYNHYQNVEISLKKVLEQDELFNIGMHDEYKNIYFGLYVDEEIVAKDGTVIPKDGLIGYSSCDENGIISFAPNIPVDTKLYIKEYRTDEHYIISDEKYPLTFNYAGQNVTCVEIEANDGVSIENKLIRGTIAVKKVDNDGFAVAGAVFGLFKANETEFTEKTALMISTSNEIGVFGFENVPYGKWIVREIKSPPSFKINTTIYIVSITTDEEIVELVIENKFILGSVKVSKIDKDNPEIKLSGAIFELYVDVDRNKEFNPEIDILVGQLNEDEVGVYIMNDLRHNGYFIHEKSAPDGYIKDDDYHYFEITEDGMLIEFEITNEKLPEPEVPVPDIPNTDEPWRLGFWIGMTAVAFGGLVAYVIITIKKKDEE